jgi:uncharacterized protein (DUF427 family)
MSRETLPGRTAVVTMSQSPTAPRITRDPRRIRVLFGGHEVGESADVLILHEPGEPPTLYFPRSDVEMAVLARTTRETSTAKGLATWFTIYRDAHVVEDAAWSFETPLAPYQAIARRIAFQTPHFEFAEHGQAPADWMIDPDGPEISAAPPSPGRDAIRFNSVEALASALQRASEAHHAHEARAGVSDPDWPGWYAAYIAAELAP